MSDYSQTASPPPRRTPAALLGLGLLIEVVLLAVVGLGNLRHHAALFIALALAAAVLYWTAIGVARAAARTTTPPQLLSWVIIPALFFRTTLLFSPPSLSDDVYRYLWDGSVLLHGINPYRYPPQAMALAFLRGPDYQSINYKGIPSIYPPLAQLAFALGAALDLGIWGPKAVLWSCELLLLWALARLLGCLGLGPERLLLYAWNPLILFEFSGSTHVDVLAVLLLVLATCAIIQERSALSTTLLGLATLAKLLPALLLPLLARRVRPIWLGLCGALILAGYLPFASAGWNLLAATKQYALRWRFNDAAFTLLYHGLLGLGLTEQAALLYGKIVVGLVLLAAIAVLALRQVSLLRGAYWILGLYLLLSPTLHPWYLAWIVPFLCIYPNRAWWMLTGLIFLSYAIQIGAGADSNQWSEPGWTKAAQFVPFYALLAWDAWRAHRARMVEAS
jgi:hypothetical protein